MAAIGLVAGRSGTGNEGRQADGLVLIAVGLMRLTAVMLTRVVLPVVVTILTVIATAILPRLVIAARLMLALLTRLVGLSIARLLLLLIGLLARRIGLGAAVVRLRIVAVVVALVVAARLSAFALLERLALTELLLRRRDQAEIMLGVLIVVFGGHRIARRGRVPGKLDVFLGNVIRGPADLHVRPVRFVNPSQRVVAFATAAAIVTTPHPMLVLTVSHGSPVANS